MLAASYWSLLEPAIELAEDSGKFGAFAFLPVAIGFTLGAAFVYFTDLLLTWLVSSSQNLVTQGQFVVIFGMLGIYSWPALNEAACTR